MLSRRLPPPLDCWCSAHSLCLVCRCLSGYPRLDCLRPTGHLQMYCCCCCYTGFGCFDAAPMTIQADLPCHALCIQSICGSLSGQCGLSCFFLTGYLRLGYFCPTGWCQIAGAPLICCWPAGFFCCSAAPLGTSNWTGTADNHSLVLPCPSCTAFEPLATPR